jgi:MA3 domain
VQAKISKTKLAGAANQHQPEGTSSKAGSTAASHNNKDKDNNHNKDGHETKVGKEGTAKRNITRKKTNEKDTGNYNSNYKKQGGHGKGQWQADVMDPSYVEEIPVDEKDPIYDVAEDSTEYILTSGTAALGTTTTTATSAGGGGVGMVVVVDPGDKRGYDPGTDKAVYGPLLTLCEFKVQLTECLYEYFDSCDADEVIRTLQELGCQEYHFEIVKKAVSLAMDKGPRERELTSRLLSCLQPAPLTHSHMEAGFTILLDYPRTFPTPR